MHYLSKYSPVFETADPPAPPVEDTPAHTPDPAAVPGTDQVPAKPKLPDAVISEITSLRGQKRDLTAELEKARREAADARAIADRLQRGDNKDATSPAHPQGADDKEIDRRADYKLFVRDVESLKQNGIREYGSAFNESVRVLQAVGADDDGFVQSVMAVDRANAHAILNTIAQDPERAVALVGMPPAQRIAELTRISIAMAAAADTKTTDPAKPTAAKSAASAATKQTSKAPAPAPIVEPGASKVVDWRSDEATDEEFTRGFNETMKARAGRR